ncbi:MAG: DUF4332 domain-containing protein [Planctomycetaceae bacterium]|nr:DUF4332 domain-containing protein [Planctomycetaceae bacterium]
MSLLYNVLFAWKCKGTHHKLALDALPLMDRPDAEQWTNVFLQHIEIYLDGSKAPDTKFRDFRNHVLHVSDNWWGGAVKAAERWYDQTVDLLEARKWPEAIYAAGVLTHYVTDPVQPFHTGQSDAETKIHRAAEWSISKSYDDLRLLLMEEYGGWPTVQLPDGDDWLEELICQGAELSHQHYEPLVRQYNFKAGVKNPPAGLSPDCRRRIAGLIGQAVGMVSVILNQALDDADVSPPPANVTVQGALSAMSIPVFWVTKRMADQKERKIVEAMFRELQETGDIVHTLPEDDRVIRDLHAREVLGIEPKQTTQEEPAAAAVPQQAPDRQQTAAPRTEVTGAAAEMETEPASTERKAPPAAPPGEKNSDQQPAAAQSPAENSRPLRFYLELDSPVVDAPSIGPKTASRLKRAKITTVKQLLEAIPHEVVERLSVRHISAEVLTEWQQQARLVCRVPGLRGHDAQLIVACGLETAEELAESTPERLLEDVEALLATTEGERIIRGGTPPDLREVSHWIASAGRSRDLAEATDTASVAAAA